MLRVPAQSTSLGSLKTVYGVGSDSGVEDMGHNLGSTGLRAHKTQTTCANASLSEHVEGTKDDVLLAAVIFYDPSAIRW